MKPTLLLLVCLATSLLMRLPILKVEYFCWDEHDYIAHNIFNKVVLDEFAIPFSNKWPLGHFLVYSLTYFSDPYNIVAYRVATAILDSLTAFVLSLTIWRWQTLNFSWALFAAFTTSTAISICLRSSPGIIAENMANLFLVSAFGSLVLSRSICWRHTMSLTFMCLACWVKPTAIFPAAGMLVGYAYIEWRAQTFQLKQLTKWLIISVLLIASCFVIYLLNIGRIHEYFVISCLEYNFSQSVFRGSSFREKLDVLFVGFAFFQFMFPLAFLYAYLFTRELSSNTMVLHFYALGAALSLLVRPAGAQTVYWLYLLPPLIAGGIVGLRKLLLSSEHRTASILLVIFSGVVFGYGWAQHLFGPAKSVYFGGGGGIRIEQTQVTEIRGIVAALHSDVDFSPKISKVFLWGMPWQLFYFAQAVPASSLLTNEAHKYGVATPRVEEIARAGLCDADYAVIEDEFIGRFPRLQTDYRLIGSTPGHSLFKKNEKL